MTDSKKDNQLSLFDKNGNPYINEDINITEFDKYEIYAEASDYEKPKDDYFKELLPERENTYEITEELKIKKILEHGLDYSIDLRKSDCKYEYDITVYNYKINGGDYKSDAIAFIEIEVSVTWINEYPSNWKTDSFLARKVLHYNYQIQEFTDELKDKAKETIYVIFNKSLTDSICCDMVTISTFQKEYIHKTDNPYNNWCLREPLNKIDKKVIHGIENCIKYIMNFLKRRT